ncbi:MAG TPA: DUF559 domain-containing protein, partial [Thermoanaerobaculia bacterium]|nr:DUF559 domain-containing protein [Thermoanaerobaculia bacterium]
PRNVHDHREGARDVAREFRKTPTKTEKIVWRWLRGRRLGGSKFRRQYPIGRYIVDFYCDALKLVVEIDGAAHASTYDYDHKRERDLRAIGLEILRIDGDRVLHDGDGVLETILLAIRGRLPLTRRFAAPSPQGEGY